LRRAHEKQQEELRQQIDTQQQGWKDAVLERSRRELAQREAKLREGLRCEQQEELRVVLEVGNTPSTGQMPCPSRCQWQLLLMFFTATSNMCLVTDSQHVLGYPGGNVWLCKSAGDRIATRFSS
jgi:hypothetical protein